MIIEIKKLSDLKPAPYNPRTSTKKQETKLQESLNKFGVVEPIIFNKQTGYIVGGHFRVRELKKLGYKEVECVIVDLSEEDEKELNIRLNANTGEWDWDTLANEWDEILLDKWGLDLPMLNDKDEQQEIEDLFNIELPFYTPSEDLPNVDDLADVSKTQELNEKIDSLKIDEELKSILKIRASFFTDFDFQKIADYYAQQTDEVKDLFEDLGMVILAPKEALKRGFINLKNEITDEWTSMF